MSISTISKALNNDLSISTLTKERVKHLANDWNYIPNEAARNFKRNKTLGEEAARLLFELIKKEDSMTSVAAQHIQIHCKFITHK